MSVYAFVRMSGWAVGCEAGYSAKEGSAEAFAGPPECPARARRLFPLGPVDP